MTKLDPIIGTWKLNVARSRFPSPQFTFKQQTEVYQEIGDGRIELTYKSIDINGASTLEVFVFPAQGGAADVLKEQIAGRSYIETKINPNEWLATCLEGGKQLYVLRKLISKDGRTLIKTPGSTDEQGNSPDLYLVLERQ